MTFKQVLTVALLTFAHFFVRGQQPANKGIKAADPVTTNSDGVDLETIPEKVLSFSPSTAPPGLTISPLTSLPFCDSEGRFLLDMLDPKDPSQHTLISIDGDKSKTYLPSSISDLHDLTVRGFYSSGPMVAFLVQGTRQSQPNKSASKSPAGYDWSSYHEYVAKFESNGTYRGSVELAVKQDISHIAIFPSGQMLAVGYDSLNSALRLLLLNSNGEIIHTLDLPAGRRPVDGGAEYGSIQAVMASEKVVSSVIFTPYKENILVWRHNSDDPILEVQPGGATREIVPQIPRGFAFLQLIPANDRWVAQFRRKDSKQGTSFDPETYTIFELRPQDGSLSARLSLPEHSPVFLACEMDGNYMTYKVDRDNNIRIYNSK